MARLITAHLSLSMGLSTINVLLKLNEEPCLCSACTFSNVFMDTCSSFRTEKG
jgi:hypothetical protein